MLPGAPEGPPAGRDAGDALRRGRRVAGTDHLIRKEVVLWFDVE